MIYSKLTIGGSEILDAYNYRVNKSLSDNNTASTFDLSTENYAGRHKTDFSVGQEIKVYSDVNNILPTFNPDAQFKFNEGTGSLFYGASGTVTGSLVNSNFQWTTGKIGSGLQFNLNSGLAYVTDGSPNAFTVNGSSSITCTFWAKPIGSQGNNFARVYENAYWTWYPMNIRCAGSNGTAFRFSMARYDSTANPQTLTAYDCPINEWSHLAFVVDRDDLTLKTYKNGVFVESKPDTTDPVNMTGSQGTIVFGNLADLTRGYNGVLDDFRFYKRKLTGEEISSIYNRGSGTESSNNGSQVLFTGITENINYTGVELDEKIRIDGRDYSARLIDRTVEPEVYTNMEVGSIVRDLIGKYTSDISSANIMSTSMTLPRIAFRHIPVYDAVKQLADLAGYSFYVDENRVLNFIPTGSTNSGYTLTAGSNLIEGDFQVDRESVYNQIWVYGDRYLDGYKETFTAGSPLGGSTFTLTYNPHNTEVTVSGALIQPGNIQNQNFTPPSGTKYLVGYDDKLIVFTSGTQYGNNIPTSGNAVVINYKRSLPIVAVGDNEVSKAAYSQRNKVTIDKDIKDPLTAQAIMEQQLAEYGNPRIEGNLWIKGLLNVTPGQLINVNLPNYNISGATYAVIESNYEFSPETNATERVMNVRLNRRIGDVTDIIKKMMIDLKKLQAGDISDGDLITRFQYTTGSIGLRTSGVSVYETPIYDSFILSHPSNGRLGILAPNYVGSIIGSIGFGSSVTPFNKCLSFTGSMAGNPRINVPSLSGLITNPGNHTASVWINLNTSGTLPSGLHLVYEALCGNVSLYPRFIIRGGSQAVYQYKINGVTQATLGISNGSTFINDWNNIVFQYDNSANATLGWLNGSFMGSIAVSAGSLTMGSDTMLIGRGDDTGQFGYFDGYMDELRIYNRVLNAGEIGSLAQKSNVDGSLVIHYRMDENAGSFIYSSAYNGSSIHQTFLGDRRGSSELLYSGGYP